MKTAYIITKSDIKTTVLPATTFALANAISGPLLTTAPTPAPIDVLLRLPKAILWAWMNLWLFNLANQRLPDSILEDSINKPWRAIPSGRLTATQARHLLLISIPIVLGASWLLGGRNECIALMVLTWIYNDLGAGDENFLVRHFLNALGFAAFGAGATQVACGFPNFTLNNTAYQWLGIVVLAITCTIQFQDMEDQPGDRLRGRKTLPIIFGEERTRWWNAFSILAISLVACLFWQVGLIGCLIPGIVSMVIAGRTLMLHGVGPDRQTFKLWCVWLITLYLLPLAKFHESSPEL
ncbi:hypothetical protein BP6252_10146 [Coleophoma cylindrospora]|uniref:Uncharacterized protein n=1 Tax=Coleophoma cylindrospora TaxID=1849047 RepID=A0A3D8QXV3_9HELO|nr:hypothetical protein BP6252_10146 [Coleophoma cylindrospora]